MLEYDEARITYDAMLVSSLKIDDNYLIANSYKSLAQLYDKQGQNEKVIPNLEKALTYALKTGVIDQDNLDKQNSVLSYLIAFLTKLHILDYKDWITLIIDGNYSMLWKIHSYCELKLGE